MRIRAKIFKATRFLVGKGRLEKLHSDVWLRLLAARDFDDLTMDSYTARVGSGFESARFNQHGLFDWETAMVDEVLRTPSHVLVTSAGGGREVIALARMGHRVTGFDASPDLVEACKVHVAQAGLEAAVLHAPPAEVPEGLSGFDALMIGRGSYHHIPGRARRIAFLQACRRTVGTGAPLLLGDVLVRADAPLARSNNRGVEAGDSIGTSFYHRFTRAELASEFAEAGFALDDIRHTPISDEPQLCHAIGRAC